MMLWARLTWQTKEPSTTAAELVRRLEVPAVPGGLVAGARLLSLGTALLEVRPWIREGPDDTPRTTGRLMLEPVPDGEETPRRDDERRPALVGLGWATVDLDRAEAELDPWMGPRPEGGGGDGAGRTDEHLGASTRLRGGAGLPGSWTILLEPSTEGRAAASLARDGEGPCALYLWPAAGLDAWLGAARDRGVTSSALRDGPFGLQVLLAGAASGPHVIIVESRTPVAAPPGTGTIAP